MHFSHGVIHKGMYSLVVLAYFMYGLANTYMISMDIYFHD